ncbi:MAG TPA: hypothetical protein PLU24_00300 [Candidatus Omnitrophota bacterium]|nr:hypothetical protein [Candidatus Omnitrophota bacterium]
MDFFKLKTYSIKKRKSKVDKSLLAFPLKKGASFKAFFDSLPNILKARDLKDVAGAIVSARRKGKPVMLLMGAHVIKCGLSPIVIKLIEKEIITSVAFNGAGIIHDFELAFCGSTSEDVAEALKDGSFGMAQETAEYLNDSIRDGVLKGLGLGESVGAMIESRNLKFKDLSIARACLRKNIPFTVHVAIGTDIIHQHPSASGAHTGEGSMRDFRTLAEETSRLKDGGVVLNFGSAVVLPEVFLKALSVARNLTGKVSGFTTANFDMNFHYRPFQNIVTRPVSGSGKGCYIIGHHEIMLPLLAQAVLERM